MENRRNQPARIFQRFFSMGAVSVIDSESLQTEFPRVDPWDFRVFPSHKVKSHAPPIVAGYSATDMTDACVPVPGVDSIISVTKHGACAGLGTVMTSRVRSNADCVFLCTAASRRLRIKRVPCVSIMMSVGSGG